MSCRFFINHVHTLFVLLPVIRFGTGADAGDIGAALKHPHIPLSASVPLSDELPSTSSKGARNMKLKVLYKAMQKILGFQKKKARQGFQVRICDRLLTFHPTTSSHFSDTKRGMMCRV